MQLDLIDVLVIDLNATLERFYATLELLKNIKVRQDFKKQTKEKLAITYQLLKELEKVLGINTFRFEEHRKLNIKSKFSESENELLKVLNTYLNQFNSNIFLTSVEEIIKLAGVKPEIKTEGTYKSLFEIIYTLFEFKSKFERYLLSVEHTTKTIFNTNEHRKEVKVAKNTVVKLLVTLNLEVDTKLSAFDFMIYDACITFYAQGFENFSTKDVFELLYNRKPRSEELLKIEKSIRKLRKTFVRLDYTEETKIRNFPTELIAGYLETYLLPLEKIEQKQSTFYQFSEKPKLFEYARAKKQIETVPIEVLNIRDLNLSENNLLLRDFLLRRIADLKGALKNNKKLLNKISLSTIYETFDANNKTARMRLREKIQKILEHFKNTHYIADYKISNKDIKIYFTLQKSSIHAA